MSLLLPVGFGLVIGFLIGLTGMGGGALMTPFLLIVMKLDPILAVGTDLAFAAITKIVGTVQHHHDGNAPLAHVLWMALGSLPASLLGAQTVLRMSPIMVQDVLPKLLGGVLILVGSLIFARATNLITPRKRRAGEGAASRVGLLGIGAVGGYLVGMTSIGGGTVIMALMILFMAFPLSHMVGLDVMHGAILALVASLSYVFAGQTDWSLVGLLLIGSVPGVWLGARAVHRINGRIIQYLLALLIVATGINLLFNH